MSQQHLEGTGKFATDEQVAELQGRVPMSSLAVLGEQPPTRKLVQFALDAGVEPREDGVTRIGLDTETREFLYAVPADQSGKP